MDIKYRRISISIDIAEEVSQGLRDLGYSALNIDYCFVGSYEGRDGEGVPKKVDLVFFNKKMFNDVLVKELIIENLI